MRELPECLPVDSVRGKPQNKPPARHLSTPDIVSRVEENLVKAETITQTLNILTLRNTAV